MELKFKDVLIKKEVKCILITKEIMDYLFKKFKENNTKDTLIPELNLTITYAVPETKDIKRFIRIEGHYSRLYENCYLIYDYECNEYYQEPIKEFNKMKIK